MDAKVFWDAYQEQGINAAMSTLAVGDEEPNIDDLRNSVPALVEEAKERSIDMVTFLRELDELDHATRTDNDGGELSVDSGTDTDQAEDAVEPAESQDDDGQAGSGAEATEAS